MTKQEQIAYCAGFFDGEGHIRICKHSVRVRWMLQISAAQATPYPLDMFVNLFGGTTKKRIVAYRGRPKAQFAWQCSSKAAENALNVMLPFLVCKRDEAMLALEFRSTFRPQYGDRSKNDPAVDAAREQMKLALEQMRRDKRSVHVVET